jgi:adenylate cyclase
MNENSMERRLRAILSADVKGYSLLMAEDEIATIRTIKSHRKTMKTIIAEHKGRVVDSPGDNLLAEFRSVVDAVESAVEIQKKLKTKNEELPKDRQMHFRIGVNVGDVVHEGDRLYGEGVNIASRIEGLADAGGVCISRNAYDHIKNKLELGYEYLGEHEVKNIKEPVRVYRVLMSADDAGKRIGEKKRPSEKKWLLPVASIAILLLSISAAVYWEYFYFPSFELPKGPSIAILPFDNMTGDPNQEFLCDGITDNIISALSQVPQLFVIARNSTFAYKGKPMKVQQISRELGAQYLVEGGIQKSEGRIRITVQLIDAKSGNHIWSERYDRELKLKEFFKLQDEITLRILREISINLPHGNISLSKYKGFRELNVFLKFLKARSCVFKNTKESTKLAQKELLEIIDIDPDIPEVYAYLAATYVNEIWNYTCESRTVCSFRAIEAFDKAIALDEKNSDAHMAYCYILLTRNEYDKAVDACARAVALNPNNADAYAILGNCVSANGRPIEGLEIAKNAIRLNPNPPAYYMFFLGHCFKRVGFKKKNKMAFKEAIAAYKKATEIEPDYLVAHITNKCIIY